jgi:hypothetical protein
VRQAVNYRDVRDPVLKEETRNMLPGALVVHCHKKEACAVHFSCCALNGFQLLGTEFAPGGKKHQNQRLIT